MHISAKSVLFLILGTGGATAIKKYSSSDNILERLSFSLDTMYESVVDPKDIEPYYSKNKPETKSGSFGEYVSNDIVRLLNVKDSKHGWNAVLQVYKRTLNGLSVNQLISSCKSILDIEHRMTKVEYLNKKLILRKFCTYPIKVRDKIKEQDIYKYSTWSNPSREHRLRKRLEKMNFLIDSDTVDVSKYCTWFPNTYTVYGDMTLDEIDYIKLCQSK